MKRAVLLIYVFTVIVVHTSSRIIITPDHMSHFHNAIDNIAKGMNISNTQVKSCYNQEDLKLKDLIIITQLMINYGKAENERSILKVGCFFSCMMRASMLNENSDPDDFIEIFSSNEEDPLLIETSDQLQDCIQKVKGHNECEIGRSFILCLIRQMQE